jgi:hypothetical protein
MTAVGRILLAIAACSAFADPSAVVAQDTLVIRRPSAQSTRLQLAIARALELPPLRLRVEVHGTTLFATSGQQPTGIIRPFRERATVIASVHVRGTGTSSEMTIRIAPVLYVNRNASGDERAWHMPSPDQQNGYRDTLFKIVMETAARICGARWVGNQMTCAS